MFDNPTSSLLEPESTLEALAEPERELRQRYLELDTSVSPSEGVVDHPGTLVTTSASFLELLLCLANFLEVVHDLNLTTTDEVCGQATRVLALINARTGLRIQDVFEENRAILPAVPERKASFRYEGALERFVRTVGSHIAASPIAYIETVARNLGLEKLGHRCRRAYDALQAFVRRNTPDQHDPHIRVAGKAYVEGRLSIEEMAVLLGLTPSDVVASLDEHGYCRPVESIELSDEARALRLAKIREDRLRRGGQPVASPSLVIRDVIATQRIEGVDARPWLPNRP